MPIIFKSKLSSSVANQTFLDKTIDDIKKGKLTLYKVTLGEADQVEDVQVFLNELADVDGVAGEGDSSAKTYSSEQIIANGDDRKVAIGKLDAQVKLNQDGIADLVSLSGVGANNTDLGTFTGTTIPDASDIKDALQSLETAHEEVDQNVNDLITLSGVAENSTDLGVFDHTIIADNETIKGALQDLEDGIKAINDDYGVAGGLATLDGTGKVPSTQLPSYVDDVLEYANLASFPVSGEQGIIYVALDTNKTYRWSGSTYIEISPSEVTSVNGQTGVVVLDNTDIGLGNVTNDAQLKRAANDFTTFTQKTTPVIADIILIEDSEDSFNKKKVALDDLNLGGSVDSVNGQTGVVVLDNTDIGLGNVTNDAQLKRAANDFTTFTEKITPVDADIVLIEDSADSYNKKKVQLSNLGLGSGVGGINYIDNYDFEKDTNGVLPVGWATYADTAGLAPVDGTGGSPNTTFLATTTTPLRGTKSAILSKNSGASRQGEGASYAFTIDSADQAQVLRISFDYSTSANYADGEIRVYVYDVTNSRLIEVIDRDLLASTQGKFVGTFQTSPDSLSYRLIFHIADTDTLQSWTVEIDNVIVGPQTIVKGAIVTDWESYTPSDVAYTWGTVSASSFYYRRNGDSLDAEIRLTLSSVVTGQLEFAGSEWLPNNLTIATASSSGAFGTARAIDVSAASTANDFLGVVINSHSSSASGIRIISASTDTYSATSPFTWASGDSLQISIRGVKINGWSSNVILSDDTGNREIVFKSALQNPTSATFDGNSNLIFPASLIDTASGYNTSTGVYTIPESGIYYVKGSVLIGGTEANNNKLELRIYNGASIINVGANTIQNSGLIYQQVNASTLYEFNKGDTVSLRVLTEITTPSITSGVQYHTFEIAKRSSPQTIAASEVVAVRASTVAGSVGTSLALFDYIDKTIDTHNAYNSGTFTAPQSGYYLISASLRVTSVILGTTGTLVMQISKNNLSAEARSLIYGNGSTVSYQVNITSVLYLSKGDFIEIDVSCSSATTATSTGGYTVLTITKLSGVN